MMFFKRLIQYFRLRRQPAESELFWVKLLGYEPKNIEIYEQALTHKSSRGVSNERLEFLGDAVIEMVVSDALYRYYPTWGEGNLTRARSKVVCRENLNKVAHIIGIDSHLKVGTPTKQNAENIYGNAFEALVGAIWLERGYDTARQFLYRVLLGDKGSKIQHIVNQEVDFKSRLLEWGQAHHQTIEFTLINEQYDAAHDRHTFTYSLLINGEEKTQAAGYSKLEAQQLASRRVLNHINKQK